MSSEKRDLHRFAFWAIFTFAAVVRLKGLSSGLPLHTLYGENETLSILQRMLLTGDLNPAQFTYPGLSYYLHLPFLYVFYWIGVWIGHFYEMTSVPQSSLIFVGRSVCAILGTFTVVLLYRTALHFGRAAALTSMAILAASPQHVEFSHMLRPEVPAVFFAVAAHYAAFALFQHASTRRALILGLLAGASFSMKYNIGLPLILTMILSLWINRKALPVAAFIAAPFGFILCFAATNPYLAGNPSAILFWISKMDSFYAPTEEYYAKNVAYFYLEYLTRYNYQLPLMILSLAGLIITFFRDKSKGALLSIYPLVLFSWLCTYEARRIHELMPLHPFIAVWAGIALDGLWNADVRTRRSQATAILFFVAFCAAVFFPYRRAVIQSFLYSKLDNRSKAELWITNLLPQGSKIALLQFHQIELDPGYFEVENFNPRDYVGKKDFRWFADHGFDYVAVSSGQYMRYFTEGAKAQKFKNYFETFFSQAQVEGTFILDLTTHPTLIPDYRIKVYSTKRENTVTGFSPAVIPEKQTEDFKLNRSGSALSLPPGYYSLKVPQKRDFTFGIRVRNLKLNETILQKSTASSLSAAENNIEHFPFAILPVRLSSQFFLFSHIQADITPNQHVQFDWKGIPEGIQLSSILPALEILSVDLRESGSQQAVKASQDPFLLFDKDQPFTLKCQLINRSSEKIIGHAEAFLSEVGESQPWKCYEIGSDIQEFVIEPGQAIPIEIPMTTNDLTGDYQLSFWVFTRQDLPFTPQNGGWFNKQIRVRDPLLGIHPIFRIPIP